MKDITIDNILKEGSALIIQSNVVVNDSYIRFRIMGIIPILYVIGYRSSINP